MRPEYAAELAALPSYAVATVVFKADADRLEVLVRQPRWMRTEGNWMLPEFELERGETIESCAARGIAALTDTRLVKATNFETRVRGSTPLGGVVSTCFASVPRKSDIKRTLGTSHYWASVERLPYLIADYDSSVAAALKLLAYSPRDVAVLISTPEFTIAELCDGLNEVRRMAGIKAKADIRNLRRQLDGAEWMSDTGRMSSGAHRPAKLYTVQ